MLHSLALLQIATLPCGICSVLRGRSADTIAYDASVNRIANVQRLGVRNATSAVNRATTAPARGLVQARAAKTNATQRRQVPFQTKVGRGNCDESIPGNLISFGVFDTLPAVQARCIELGCKMYTWSNDPAISWVHAWFCSTDTYDTAVNAHMFPLWQLGRPAPLAIIDTPGWTNGQGQTCQTYAANGWCSGGAFAAGQEWTGKEGVANSQGQDAGEFYGFPGRNCGACGKSPQSVFDTPGWTNGQGNNCAGYAAKGHCKSGAFAAGHEWSGLQGAVHQGRDAAALYNYPALNCVACGKKADPVGPPNLQSVVELSDFAPDLVQLGIKLFGSQEALDVFLKGSRPPVSISFDGLGTRLKESIGDNSVQRLSVEAGDTYGIARITETDGVFVDIGMNLGAVTIAVAKKFPGLQIISVEPIPSTYFLARLNLRLNAVNDLAESSLGVYPGIPGVFALQRAVASVEKVIPMEYSLTSTQDSLIKGQHEDWSSAVRDCAARPDICKTWRKSDVHTLVLQKFLTEHQIQQLRFLKMDCEGCEFDAIPPMANWLTNKGLVQRFAGEIHRVKVKGAMDMANTQNFDGVLTARGCMPDPGECYMTQC